MKCSTMKSKLWSIQWILLAIFTVGLSSCKDDDNSSSVTPYNPGQPVEITDFTPETGGGNTRVVVYGKNFGTDTSLLKLTVGGKEAKIISVLSDCMYAIVPQKAYKGNFVLTVGEGEQAQTVEAKKKFNYERQMVVSALCGNMDEKGNYDVKDGPFNDCGGLAEPTWLSFDPKNKDILYIAQDNGKNIRVLDLANEYLYTGLRSGDSGMGRMRTITWSLDGDTMIVSNDQGDKNYGNNFYIKRKTDMEPYAAFNTGTQTLQVGNACNGSAIHPVNGELYYNSYSLGDVYKFDYWSAHKELGFDYTKREHLYTIQDRDWEFNIVIHPTGNYAYLVMVNKHYIMRTDYDWKKKRFGNPYLFCGSVGNAAWVDGTGNSARLSTPYQGVFVKNKDYVANKAEDEYDFYFADRNNHCIRKLTPDGSVTTFAGRGGVGDPNGYTNGGLRSEARFRQPCGLAYDETTETFYVGDVNNHRIRKIAMEEPDEEATGETDIDNN